MLGRGNQRRTKLLIRKGWTLVSSRQKFSITKLHLTFGARYRHGHALDDVWMIRASSLAIAVFLCGRSSNVVPWLGVGDIPSSSR